MVHAEQFRLRTNSDVKGDCHDYIGLCTFIYLYISCICIFYLFVFVMYLDFLTKATMTRIWSRGQHPSVDEWKVWKALRSSKRCQLWGELWLLLLTLFDDNHGMVAWWCARWKWSPPSHHKKILQDDNNYVHNAIVIRVCEVVAMLHHPLMRSF